MEFREIKVVLKYRSNFIEFISKHAAGETTWEPKHCFVADDGTLSREIMSDLVHPTKKGYVIWAEAVEDKIVALMEDNNDK